MAVAITLTTKSSAALRDLRSGAITVQMDKVSGLRRRTSR